ncbi:hypothetical protein KPL78_01525 [Roseomonas sp. HJA6]|uniref:Sulfotransferase family protein n=2 Tax=Roseomonas alba TaxID=2846776 RepID=A0ABS7A2G9_9PROT|nr:hypothetical protein [Neoroseomonas alba]
MSGPIAPWSDASFDGANRCTGKGYHGAPPGAIWFTDVANGPGMGGDGRRFGLAMTLQRQDAQCDVGPAGSAHPPARLFLLLAAERSGTHLFRSILTANRAAFAPGEVANAAASGDAESDTNFFAFCRERLLDEPRLFVPSQPHTRQLLDAYFGHFRARAASLGRSAAVCDIKYGHVINFSGGWWDMISAPYLLEWARQSDVGIIHLVRRNVAQTCISNLYAQHTGVWRTRNPTELAVMPMQVARRRLEADIGRMTRVIDLFRGWVKPCRHCEIHYEDLLDGLSPSWRALRGFLGHPLDRIASDFLKTTPAYEEIIENHGEIADLLEVELPAQAS